MKLYNSILIAFVTLILISCGHTTRRDGPPAHDIDVSRIPNAVPRELPLSDYGNPKTYVVHGKRYHTMRSSKGFKQIGIASWYGTLFDKNRTSSGEPYDMFAMTAAHKSLPLPTFVKVTNLENGRVIIVKINDRGPFHDDRIIDLSYAAAKKLGVYPKGTAKVKLEAIDPKRYTKKPSRPHYTPGADKDYYIQAGAFHSYQNARRFQKDLKKLTQYPVQIKRDRVKVKRWYFVQVGPIDTRERAHTATANLSRHHVSDTIIIAK